MMDRNDEDAYGLSIADSRSAEHFLKVESHALRSDKCRGTSCDGVFDELVDAREIENVGELARHGHDGDFHSGNSHERESELRGDTNS